MKMRRSLVLAAMLGAGLVGTALAAPHKRVSPHETISDVISGDRVTVVYGRPYTKDPRSGEPRKIWGGVVAFDKVWRLGADEATMLVTEQPLMFGDVTVPAGAYTLYMLPAADGSAKLIINKQLGQWGTEYKEDQDLARVDMKKTTVDPAVDQLTLGVAKDGQAGLLKVTWDTLSYSADFSVKK
jgi:hypothetical protein